MIIDHSFKQLVSSLLELKDKGLIGNDKIISTLFDRDLLEPPALNCPAPIKMHYGLSLIKEILAEYPGIGIRVLRSKFIAKMISEGKTDAAARKDWQRSIKKYSAV